MPLPSAKDTEIALPLISRTNKNKTSKPVSLNHWIKVCVFIAGLAFLSLLMNDNISWDYHSWKPIKYKENVVWNHGSTMAVLELLGEKRTKTLVKCRLILVETR